MNEHEELLARAWACLSEASKIQDPVVRDKVLELVYQSQQVAQAALLRDLDGRGANHEASVDGVSSTTPQTNPKAGA
jgi:hypothetical protein